MESISKRGRGRPKGSGKDDNAMLQQVASQLAEKPGMKPWAAINAVVQRMPEEVLRAANVKIESVVHRLNVKWRCNGDALLAAARRARDERIAAKRRADAEAARRQYAEMVGVMAESATQMAGRAAPVMANLESRLQQMLGSPQVLGALATMAEIQSSSAVYKATEVLASPRVQGALAAMAEFQASPLMRQVMELTANLIQHRVEIPSAVLEMASAQAKATDMLACLDTPHLAASRALLERNDLSATAEAARQLRYFG